MSKDTNFDQHSQRFRKNIYDTDKGRLRLQLITEDLVEKIPALTDNKPLNILDAGCGMGHIGHFLAEKNHMLTMCDISSELLAIAEQKLIASNLHADFYHTSVQALPEEHNDQYDLVIFHAVLEWLDDPESIIQELKRLMKPGGLLSLMFYNKNSIVYHNILKGNFRKIVNQQFKGHPGGLTPINPIDPDELNNWLASNGLSVDSIKGIRIFYDYLSRDLKQNRSYDDILELERLYANKKPYNMMGRYIHYLCRLSV